MAAVRLLHGIYRQEAHSVDAQLIQFGFVANGCACPSPGTLSSACKHSTLVVDPLQQLLPRLHERLCAVALQLRRQRVDINAGSREACDHRFGVAAVFGHRAFDLAVRRECV